MWITDLSHKMVVALNEISNLKGLDLETKIYSPLVQFYGILKIATHTHIMFYKWCSSSEIDLSGLYHCS